MITTQCLVIHQKKKKIFGRKIQNIILTTSILLWKSPPKRLFLSEIIAQKALLCLFHTSWTEQRMWEEWHQLTSCLMVLQHPQEAGSCEPCWSYIHFHICRSALSPSQLEQNKGDFVIPVFSLTTKYLYNPITNPRPTFSFRTNSVGCTHIQLPLKRTLIWKFQTPEYEMRLKIEGGGSLQLCLIFF